MTSWMHHLIRRVAAEEGDRGVSLIVVVLFMAAIAAIASTVTLVSVHGLRSAANDRQAAGAQQTAEGGIAAAMQIIRAEQPAYFNCMEPAAGQAPSATCTSNPAGWTNPTSPEKVSANGTIGSCVTGFACYNVWIGTITAYAPPTVTQAVYRIHSTGYYGGGPGARSLSVTVSAEPQPFPLGLYADTVNTNGTPNVYHESLFSLGCITNRVRDGSGGGGLSFATSAGQPLTDYAYDQPAAAHSVDKVTTANNGCTDSMQGGQGPVHKTGDCNTTFPYDQDSEGGSLTGTTCDQSWTSPTTGRRYPTTSAFTYDDLVDVGYRPGGLSRSVYDYLKTQAKATNTYFTSASSVPSSVLTATSPDHVVIYYDLGSSGGTVQFGPGDFPSKYFRSPSASSCPLTSVVIVVDGQHTQLTYNATGSSGTSSLVGSIFVPNGSYDSQGNASIIGTLYAQTVSLHGGQTFQLDQCFVNNPPGLLNNVRIINYHVNNTQNIQ